MQNVLAQARGYLTCESAEDFIAGQKEKSVSQTQYYVTCVSSVPCSITICLAGIYKECI
jgi:hypothetical protein